MNKKGRSSRAKVRVPIFWRICNTLAMIPLAALTFFLIFRASGGVFPPVAGGSTDPYFFAGVFAVVLPFLLWLIVDHILHGVVMKRSGREIAAEIAKEAALAAGVAVLDAVLGGGGSDSRSSSSSGDTSGEGGQFGGGGASGSF
jgi:uncharacterized membrane protein YgcG